VSPEEKAAMRGGNAAFTCFARDEGKSLRTGIQVQILNRLWMLQSKIVVLNPSSFIAELDRQALTAAKTR
jgi:hypothetical protein